MKTKIQKTIKRREMKTLIKMFNGKFFYTEFTKSNGELRKMIGRTGVGKYVKGTGKKKKYNPTLVTVWDTDYQEYRTINLNAVHKINCNGISYDFN